MILPAQINIKQFQPYYCEILALPDTFTFQLVNKYRWGKQELSSGGRQWADRRIRKPFQAVLCFDLKSTTCPRKSRAWHRKDGSLPVCLHWGYHFLVEMMMPAAKLKYVDDNLVIGLKFMYHLSYLVVMTKAEWIFQERQGGNPF